MNRGNRFAGVLGENHDIVELCFPEMPLRRRVAELVREYLAPQGGRGLVFEAGCCTGMFSACLLEANPDIELVLNDEEETVLARAHARVRPFRPHKLTCYQDDVLVALCYYAAERPGEIKAFTSYQTLYNLERQHRVKVLKAVARAMQPGGLFIQGDLVLSNDRHQALFEIGNQLQDFALLLIHRKRKMFEEWVKHFSGDIPNLWTLAEWEEALTEAGFGHIKIDKMRRGITLIMSAVKL
jgi:SAM-dependent methyltransferase